MYITTDKKVGIWIKFLNFLILKTTPIFIVVPKLIASYILYYTTDAGSEAFELPTPVWYPFDWKNPKGYLIAISIQFVVISIILYAFLCMLILQVEALLMTISMAKDIKYSLYAINKKSKANRANIVEPFTEVVQFHSNAKW